jgi:hypothetical protein
MTRSIFMEKLPFHPLLGRNVYLDSESKRYAVQPTTVPIVSKRHGQFISVLDQGQVGSCTGNASTSCAYHEPFFAAGMLDWRYAPDEAGAQGWYHDNTANDTYAGTWTPDDTGSDGLTSSKMAVAAGVASGYRAALDLDSSLQALMTAPGITGVPWYHSMFTVGTDGLLTVDMASGLAGGHELVVDEVVAADAPGNGTGKLLVGGDNSWGESWGAHGRWYMPAEVWWALRREQGDVYFWVPAAQPAPTPTPSPDTDSRDVDLWAIADEWSAGHHVGENHKVAVAIRAWARLKGLS